MARCSKISTAVPHLALGSSAIVSAGLGTNFRCLSSVLSGDQMAFISGKDLWRRGSPNWSFVHLSPGFLPLCLGQMAGFPQLLSACFCLLRLCGTNGCCFRKVSLDGCPSCFVHFVPHSPCSTQCCVFLNCLPPLCRKRSKNIVPDPRRFPHDGRFEPVLLRGSGSASRLVHFIPTEGLGSEKM